MSSFIKNNEKKKKKKPRKKIDPAFSCHNTRVPSPLPDNGWDLSPEGESSQTLTTSFAAQCSLDPKTDSVVTSQPARVPWADSDVKDPFLLLPWFALEELLVHLPDLPTLHQLCRASPAVADYLYNTPGVFPMVFERIVDPCHFEIDVDSDTIFTPKPRDFEAGLNKDTRIFFRTLVYLWWREESAANNVPGDENPIPGTFYHESMWYTNQSATGWLHVDWLGSHKLPRSTPLKILRHLLSLASRIRADAHAFFHEAIGLLRSIPLEVIGEWKIKKAYWPKGGRPRGTQFPRGGYGPPTWLEEQRLTQAFLKPYLFSVLRRVVCEKGLLDTTPPPPTAELPNNIQRMLEEHPNTLQQLKDNSLLDFWRPFTDENTIIDSSGNRVERIEPMEQLETVLTWMEVNKVKASKRRNQRPEFTTCCPEFGELSEAQLQHGAWSLQFLFQHAATFAQNCTVIPHSGVQGAGLRGEFQQFGVAFWDDERMMGLGLSTKRMMNRWADQKELAFAWSGLLFWCKKKGIKVHGKKKGWNFRSRTAPIP
ncbi:unnamed protein product [Penicillium nalgiovense]|uniref:Uncharacterized protein n=2 Tax=Penicillium nalgiovense TaxID=60175 RepID=A0A9W4MIM7_PENNA|nr:unnamed protein product [Penicillium nalgiovense]CAG7936042.1 unnamed protein product [Penicillium nalgiovense]CAG7936366.1 unnamed protein product [Penicillium nalgiovense]CAG7937249.1 unnamed protein product [Penicillium nalgiovense]CAG7939251.1 unnamed protein product [Penicillium nalgiovense]